MAEEMDIAPVTLLFLICTDNDLEWLRPDSPIPEVGGEDMPLWNVYNDVSVC